MITVYADDGDPECENLIVIVSAADASTITLL